MEKGQLLPSRSSSPPPYEATAYPRRRAAKVHLRSLAAIKTSLIVFIAACLVWLCATVARLSQLHSPSSTRTLARDLLHFDEAVAQCEGLDAVPARVEAASRTGNSRWNAATGQNETVVLRNARLFDGETVLSGLVDVIFSKGLVTSVEGAGKSEGSRADAVEFDVHGRYVTPGLVDMHSHHMTITWPNVASSDDNNEMHPDTKAFTPMIRVLEGLKAYDKGTEIVMSGGITTSLLLPGSANLMGGEGTAVKNVLFSGANREPVVEDLLVERGTPVEERHRYMKMAFGENPRDVWGYTRLGNAWHLREHMQKAKDLKEKQDDYCAAVLASSGAHDTARAAFVQDKGKFPFDIALESTVAVLRGRVIVQNHNYETQDIEGMLRIAREFGFTVSGFHHATEAWQVPEMLKAQAENITIATFAEFSLYKWEAYMPSLYAGHILDKHGVAVAYKSDHVMQFTNAKYLASQAAVGHSFLLPEEKALRSITSIPAKAMDMDNRVGYCRPGYDADIVVWDSHPLSLGATPMQVFIDGLPQLDQGVVEESMGANFTSEGIEQTVNENDVQMRFEPDMDTKQGTCAKARQGSQNFVVTGIEKAFVDNYPELAAQAYGAAGEPLELVIVAGRVSCLGSAAVCAESKSSVRASSSEPVEIKLQHGTVLPGLTAVTSGLGMREIASLEDTGDGESKNQKIGDPDSVVYAKYGVWLDGKQFARARLGGVTRAVSPPLADSSGMVHGVSVEILTSGDKGLADGGIVQRDVALHVSLGDQTKLSEGTVSSGVQKLRKMLDDGKEKNNATVYGQVAAGELPLVVFCNNKYDLQQLVMIKQDYPETNIVVEGGKEASFVAKELAAAKIPVILSGDRGAPDTFREKDTIVGPPLSRSVASHLSEAGVHFAISINDFPMRSSWRLHDLAPEASWTAKFAGLGEKEAVDLVSKNVEGILGLAPSKDLVVFEGSPLRYGATVVLAFHANDETGELEVSSCFPGEDDFQ